MKLFLLTPLDKTAKDWNGSTYCGPVYVEAFDAEEARHIAGRYFAPPIPDVPRAELVYRPWWNHALVGAMETNDRTEPTFPFISIKDVSRR